jgi:6-phosphofructokinase 2
MDPGGGGINVARAIHKIGGKATAVFPSGGYTGKYFNRLMEDEQIPCIIIESSNETRENFHVLVEETGKQYRFGLPGTELTESEWKQCLKAVEEIKDVDFIVASGSIPPGVPTDVYAQLAIMAKNQNAKLVLDTSGDALKAALLQPIYLIKPNLNELSSLGGTARLSEHKIESAAREITEKYNCQIVVVSLGKDGAMLVTSSETHKVKAPDVPPKSTVGAGDSMVAGIVFYLDKGHDLKESLQYGVACGTAATMHPGTELCNKKDADELFSRIKREMH